MKNVLIYPAGTSEACRYAGVFLKQKNLPLVDHPTPEVTHVLLDVPTNPESAKKILPMIPVNAAVIGGNLPEGIWESGPVSDLLKNEAYLAANAAITAECAIRVAAPLLKTTFSDTPTLVIGWGRIGKCLAKLLRAMDCPVTVAVRQEKDRAALRSLGYDALQIQDLPPSLSRYRLIFNTAPEPVLTAGDLAPCSDCIKIDLASRRGLLSEEVIHARGLPGKYTPESSGKLIAESLLHCIKEGI